MSQVNIKDASGATVAIARAPDTHNGTAASAAAIPVAMALDDALIGATNSAAAASDIAVASVNSLLKRIAQNLSTVNASLSGVNVQLPSTTSGVALASITRPANTTAYSVGDVVGGVVTLATGLTNGQRAMIASADLMPMIAALPTGMTTFAVYLYSASPGSALADNAPFTLPSGDRGIFLGAIGLPAAALIGGTVYTQGDALNRPVQLGGSANLYAYLVTAAGFTPAANSEVYQLRMHLLGL